MSFPTPAFITLDGWAGRTRHAVTVIGETDERYRVRNDTKERVPMAGRCRWLESGATALVPKYAVIFDTPPRPTNVADPGDNPTMFNCAF